MRNRIIFIEYRPTKSSIFERKTIKSAFQELFGDFGISLIFIPKINKH